MVRWICLFQGIDTVFTELENMDIDMDFEHDKRLFNRIDRALNKYIRERFFTVREDLRMEYDGEGE